MKVRLSVLVVIAFQSTLPRGERPFSSSEGPLLFYFNPRSHEGSDAIISCVINMRNISIHAPTRGATLPFEQSAYILHISIHAPTRGATLNQVHRARTRSISIHAPTRGATSHSELPSSEKFISIHAPTRGATGKIENMEEMKMDFNPRSHEGSDEKAFPHLAKDIISIHAPTRGATF